MASISLTAVFKDGVIGVVNIDVEALDWIPVDMAAEIDEGELPRELLKLRIASKKGAADLVFQSVPFSSVRWHRE